MIRLHQVRKSIEGSPVLDGVSLDVARGEVVALIGPSGGGKSTLLRCINGLTDFQQGELRVGDITLQASLAPPIRAQIVGKLRRQVGMVFQQFNLFPHFTVLGNVIESPMHVLRMSREQAICEARQFLERVGMTDKAERMPQTLSGGEQQRVAIARALAMRPEVLLFDEPTSALDPRMAAEVETVIADLAQSGQTMIVVTHSMRLARRAARAVHVLCNGRIVESGPSKEVLDAPRHEATRAMLADVNDT